MIYPHARLINDINWQLFLFLPDYECYEENSVYGYEYDPTTGNCTCKAGWFGNKCQGKLKITKQSQWSEHKEFVNSKSG